MALVVEDGTGLATAESYISVDDASTYINSYYLPSELQVQVWASLDTTTKEVALRRSTRDIDGIYGKSFLSVPLVGAQALRFPRVPFYETGTVNLAGPSVDGYWYINTGNKKMITGIPPALKNAVAELALILLGTDGTGPTANGGTGGGVDVTGTSDRSGQVKRDLAKVGGVMTEQEYFYAQSATAMSMRKVSTLLVPFLTTNPFGPMLGIVRG